MKKVLVSDCGRDTLKELIFTCVNDGYDLISMCLSERHTNSLGIVFVTYTLVFIKEE